MDKKTLTELDYYRIRDEVQGFCVSEEGRNELSHREPFTDYSQYDYLKKLSREWLKCFSSQRNIMLHSWEDISSFPSVLRTEGAGLSLSEIFALGNFCIEVKNIQESILASQIDLQLHKLADLVKRLPELSAAREKIFRVVDKSGMLRDLPELREIRNAIASIKKDIEATIKKYTTDPLLSGALESNLPSLRSDRQVLAVKSSQRSRVKGIIHEVSNSGNTVFIEPEDIVRKNNDLLQEEFRLEQETRKILVELTGSLSDYADDFVAAEKIMTTLDTTSAACRWGMAHNCTYAQGCGDEKKDAGFESIEPPQILEARHPLLKEKAVGINLSFMGGKRILIITGPNTGGKTVSIKTFSLFAMLNQSGFPIPAAEGSRLPCFKKIFSDIGDEQSLDESLSTFSGHMKNLARALEGADDKSLVLLDELGSGTDPQEGSAIAMAALDLLIEKGSFVLITTHHGILKNYGYTHPACVNASVEFDSTSLKPTYRFLMGIPGESHAIDIARQSGLDAEIIEKAKTYIATEQTDISKLIQGLNEKHAELDSLLDEYQKKEERITERSLRNSENEIKLRQREHDLKVQEGKKESRFLSDARKQLENLVRILKEGEVTRDKTLQVKEFISDLTSSIEKHSETLEAEEVNLERDKEALLKKLNSHKSNKPTRKKTKNSDALKTAEPVQVPENLLSKKRTSEPEKLEYVPGAKVVSLTTKMEGILLRKEKKDLWSVRFGSMKISVREKELKLVASAETAPLRASVSYDLIPDDERTKSDNGIQYDMFQGNKPLFELRLLGLRGDEAIKLLERQLDLCTINGFREFSVIHGKGSGVLQQMVWDYLSHYPGIAEFNFAMPEDGGSGKTYVKLK